MKKKYALWDTYKYMYCHLWNYSHKFAFQIIIEIITAALEPLIGIVLSSVFIGLLEKHCSIQELIVTCLSLFIVSGIIYGIHAYCERVNNGNYITYRISIFWPRLLDISMKLPYALYEQNDIQNLSEKATKSIGTNRWGLEGFYRSNTRLVISLLGLCIYSLVLSNINFWLVFLLFVLSVIQYLFYIYARNYRNKYKDKQAEYLRNHHYFSNLGFDLKGAKDIRLYQLQNWIMGLYQKYHDLYRKQLSKEQNRFFLYDLVGLILQLLRDGVCYGYLIYQLSNGLLIGEFVLYLGVVSGFGNWFKQIGDEVGIISTTLNEIADYRHYEDLCIYHLNKKEEVILNDNGTFDIVFDDVCFTYPNSNENVLDHLSFHIHSGEKIALVGVNGAGKTTLVKLLCGFYQPTSGKIWINGKDMTTLNKDAYMNLVSVLFQDAVTFSFTIAQNITGQCDDYIDKEKLQFALQKSGLDEKIETLPLKENTFFGKEVQNDGVQLSGGQLQKLYLARAIYKGGQLLILDEPTAALDALAESEMYQKYSELVEHKTSVFISHRLSSTRFCDKIFFLENGKIIEEGTHEQLMQQNGVYANMFYIQSQYYVEEDCHES